MSRDPRPTGHPGGPRLIVIVDSNFHKEILGARDDGSRGCAARADDPQHHQAQRHPEPHKSCRNLMSDY